VGTSKQARLFGVLGDPIEHSLSPAMHNAAFAACDLPHLYLRHRVTPAELPAALADARRLGMGGLNLTVPLKETVLPLLDDVTPAARRIGAANTLVFRGRRIVGDNTDGRGFVRSLRGHVQLRGARVVVIGAGGSARAVASALLDAGCAGVNILNRTRARAEQLADRLGGAPAATVFPLRMLETGEVLVDARLVVNTTSTGLTGATIATRFGAAPRDCLFVDLLYGPTPTPWRRAAARAGRPTLDGSGMLLHQGALAFEAWTQRPAPLAAMTRALGTAGLALSHRAQPHSART
jgi:shikimate dehydrogenase